MTSQLLELGLPVVVALNMIDLAEKRSNLDAKLPYVGVYHTVVALAIPVPHADQLNQKVVCFYFSTNADNTAFIKVF